MIGSLVSWLLGLLRSPSGFDVDPWGFLRNQVLHGLIFGAAPVLLGAPWIIVCLVYWFAIEQTQITFFKGEVWDGLEDVTFVTLAALACAYWLWPLLIITALLLASGALRRKRDRQNATG